MGGWNLEKLVWTFRVSSELLCSLEELIFLFAGYCTNISSLQNFYVCSKFLDSMQSQIGCCPHAYPINTVASFHGSWSWASSLFTPITPFSLSQVFLRQNLSSTADSVPYLTSSFQTILTMSFSNFRICQVYILDKQMHSQLSWNLLKSSGDLFIHMQSLFLIIISCSIFFMCPSHLYLFCMHVLHPLFSHLQLVTHWILYEGVRKQFAALREGFESFFPISSLNLFYADEVIILCFNKNFIKLFWLKVFFKPIYIGQLCFWFNISEFRVIFLALHSRRLSLGSSKWFQNSRLCRRSATLQPLFNWRHGIAESEYVLLYWRHPALDAQQSPSSELIEDWSYLAGFRKETDRQLHWASHHLREHCSTHPVSQEPRCNLRLLNVVRKSF